MFGIFKVFLLLWCAIVSASAAEPGRVTELMTKALANVPGKEVTMITVDHPPGGVDAVHRHNASVFVYMLEGSMVMQIKGDKEVILHPGETFYEAPDAVHLISRNASDSKPAKFLVLFVKDKGAPILVPTKE
jgi:quercetin dioxygenase-like cupin family protein